MTWGDYCDDLQWLESQCIRLELEEHPVSKDYPVKIMHIIDSNSSCPCPVCGERLDLWKIMVNQGGRCPSCNQLYKTEDIYT